MQHNCYRHKCSVVASAKRIRQEREDTDQYGVTIRHNSPDDVMVNCAQMRDYQYVQFFHTPPKPLNREVAIHEGAARELGMRRERQKKVDERAAKDAAMGEKTCAAKNSAPSFRRNASSATAIAANTLSSSNRYFHSTNVLTERSGDAQNTQQRRGYVRSSLSSGYLAPNE